MNILLNQSRSESDSRQLALHSVNDYSLNYMPATVDVMRQRSALGEGNEETNNVKMLPPPNSVDRVYAEFGLPLKP